MTAINQDQFKNKFRVTSARLGGWDYGSNAFYYITICTENRTSYFGDVRTRQAINFVETHHTTSQNTAFLQQQDVFLEKTIIGEVAYQNWMKIPDHFPFVELDEFVLMPNHLHGILYINKPDKNDWEPNKYGIQSQNLASIIRGYKASVKTFSTINKIEFFWQPRYYDHIIRNEKEYENISRYIAYNPQQWFLDGDNVDNLFNL